MVSRVLNHHSCKTIYTITLILVEIVFVYASYSCCHNAGYTWLELSPLTGRKHQVYIITKYYIDICMHHCLMIPYWFFTLFKSYFNHVWVPQLRVHCAEVLGTPIVGDYKYGWQAHRKWKELHSSDLIKNSNEKVSKEKALPFGLDLENGSIFGKHPHLHLHCKEMILPNVSQAVQAMQSSSDYDLSELKTLKLVAPLPSHMQRSWDFMNCWTKTIIAKTCRLGRHKTELLSNLTTLIQTCQVVLVYSSTSMHTVLKSVVGSSYFKPWNLTQPKYNLYTIKPASILTFIYVIFFMQASFFKSWSRTYTKSLEFSQLQVSYCSVLHHLGCSIRSFNLGFLSF